MVGALKHGFSYRKQNDTFMRWLFGKEKGGSPMIEITSMEATKKLPQNRDENNYKNIISELEKQI